MIWEMHEECPHYSDYKSGIVPPKTAIYYGPHYGKFPSINATYASHGPMIMSRSKTCSPYSLNVPKKIFIGWNRKLE